MVNVSASMARPLADHIVDMVETVRRLGPNPVQAAIYKSYVVNHKSGMETAS
jgi:hypothetical protein